MKWNGFEWNRVNRVNLAQFHSISLDFIRFHSTFHSNSFDFIQNFIQIHSILFNFIRNRVNSSKTNDWSLKWLDTWRLVWIMRTLCCQDGICSPKSQNAPNIPKTTQVCALIFTTLLATTACYHTSYKSLCVQSFKWPVICFTRIGPVLIEFEWNWLKFEWHVE